MMKSETEKVGQISLKLNAKAEVTDNLFTELPNSVNGNRV